MDTCRTTFLGKGRFVVDARPLFDDVIPGSLYVFLSEPSAKRAVAGFGDPRRSTTRTPTAGSAPDIARSHAQQPVITVNLFNDPTPDGRLRVPACRLLPENFGRLPFSVAELRVESSLPPPPPPKKKNFNNDPRLGDGCPKCPASGPAAVPG